MYCHTLQLAAQLSPRTASKLWLPVLTKTGPAAKPLSWQRHNGCHFASFVMCIFGAKFEDHRSNIAWGLLDLVFYCFKETIWRHYSPHSPNTKTSISLKRKTIFQKGKRHSSLFRKAFQIINNWHFKTNKDTFRRVCGQRLSRSRSH